MAREKVTQFQQPTPRLLAAWIFANEPWVSDPQLDKILAQCFPNEKVRNSTHYRILWNRGKMLCVPNEDPRKFLNGDSK